MSEETTTGGTRRVFTDAELAKCRALLAEDSAVLVSLERGTWLKRVAPVTPSAAATFRDKAWVRMVRRWPRISDGDRALCEEFLARFASAKNATVTPPATEPPDCNTVDSPKTDRETFAGTWRMRKTALTPIKTDPMQQGVYQTLVWPADFDGEAGDFCSEVSPLHHEDASLFNNASALPEQHTQAQAGTIVRIHANVDPETGLYSGQIVTDTATQAGLYGTWSDSDDRLTLRLKGEHWDAPLFPTAFASRAAAVAAIKEKAALFCAGADAAARTQALEAAIPLHAHPVMTSTADMDQYGRFSVTAEITFPVSSVVAALRKQKRQAEVFVSFSNLSAEPSWADCLNALPAADKTFAAALPLLDYKMADGGAPRKNEFGLLDGNLSWRIPVQDADNAAANSDGLVGTWSKSAERVTLRIRGDFQEAPIFPTLSSLDTDYPSAVTALATDFKGTANLPSGTPIVTTTADMDGYGLFTVTAEITWAVPRVIVSLHGHRRWVDVEVAFHGGAAIPEYSGTDVQAAMAEDAAKTHPVMVSDAVQDSHITASLTVRGDEFGTIGGEVVYRVPVREIHGWIAISETTDDVVYRRWGWNQDETGSSSGSGNNIPLLVSSAINSALKKADTGVLYTHRIDVDFNEFGLVDYVVTAGGDKAPYPVPNGLTFVSGKEPNRYRFRANHTGASNPTTNTGFVELVYTTSVTTLKCYESIDDATAAAESYVTSAGGDCKVECSLGRHGAWHTLAIHETNHHSASNQST